MESESESAIYHSSICDDRQFVFVADVTPNKDEDTTVRKDMLEFGNEGSSKILEKDPFGCRYCRRTGTYKQAAYDGPFHSKECPRYKDT